MADRLASSVKLVQVYEHACAEEYTHLLEEMRSDVTFSQIETQSKLAGLRAVAFMAWQHGFDDGASSPDENEDAYKNPYRDRL